MLYKIILIILIEKQQWQLRRIKNKTVGDRAVIKIIVENFKVAFFVFNKSFHRKLFLAKKQK